MKNRKLTLFHGETLAKLLESVQKYFINRLFSMKLSYFLEIFLQRSYMNVCSLQLGLSCLTVKTLRIHERMELSWVNNVYNTEFSVEIRLEHGFALIPVVPVPKFHMN